MPKILIIGYARHGKDTVAEIWRDEYGMTFESSSMACCKRALFPFLSKKYGYLSVEECYKDRTNHRKEWYDMICDYNKDDASRLCREIIYEDRNDCYVGMRAKREFLASRYLFDLVVFVDSSERLPPESKESCTISIEDADIVIRNNGTFEEFTEKIKKLGKLIFSVK